MENARKPRTNREWLMEIYNEVKGHRARIVRLEWLVVTALLGISGILLEKAIGG